MIGYSATHVFSQQDQDLLPRVDRLVRELPERDATGEVLRCHEVARVVAAAMHKTMNEPHVVDGKFGIVDHSWIVLRSGKRSEKILDPYAVGRLPMVQLVDQSNHVLPQVYRSGTNRDDIRHRVIEELLATMFNSGDQPLRRALHDHGHCGKTEPCADDVYCNCSCVYCRAQDCHRPGCKCERRHV